MKLKKVDCKNYIDQLKVIQERQGFIAGLLKNINGEERHTEQPRVI